MLKKVYSPLHRQARKCSSAEVKPQKKPKPTILLDENIRNLIVTEEIKPRKQPGVAYHKNVILPEWVQKAIKLASEKYPSQQLITDSEKFFRHLAGRHPPAEQDERSIKLGEIKKLLSEEKRFENIEPSDKVEKKLESLAMKRLMTNVRYGSSPIEYDAYRSALYMMARSAPDYAILYKIFREIRSRDEDFHVKTLLDFGSGIGTVSWAAAQCWPDTIKEQICIDASKEMTDLAEELAKHSEPTMARTFYRQYLPVAPRIKFNMVVSAFTLFELPDRRTRLETVMNLWKKTDNYLVLVEQGTNAGFRMITEARDLLLHLLRSRENEDPPEGHLFAPCPHELPCPRVAARDETPCNFAAFYTTLSLHGKGTHIRPLYSYVIFKKGPPKDPKEIKWPRLVRNTSTRSRCATCRMCTPDGKLTRIIFSAGKHERPLFYCARVSEWGDRLPIEIINETDS